MLSLNHSWNYCETEKYLSPKWSVFHVWPVFHIWPFFAGVQFTWVYWLTLEFYVHKYIHLPLNFNVAILQLVNYIVLHFPKSTLSFSLSTQNLTHWSEYENKEFVEAQDLWSRNHETGKCKARLSSFSTKSLSANIRLRWPSNNDRNIYNYLN